MNLLEISSENSGINRNPATLSPFRFLDDALEERSVILSQRLQNVLLILNGFIGVGHWLFGINAETTTPPSSVRKTTKSGKRT
jgi:hypothetical protein